MATSDMIIHQKEKLDGIFIVWRMSPVRSILWAQPKIQLVVGGIINLPVIQKHLKVHDWLATLRMAALLIQAKKKQL